MGPGLEVEGGPHGSHTLTGKRMGALNACAVCRAALIVGMARHCSVCGSRIGTGSFCPECGGDAGILLRVRSAPCPPAGLPWPLSLLGPWPVGDRVLLHGVRGSGKSTLAFTAIRWALERGAPAVWCSTEQTPEQVGRYALRCLGPELSGDLQLLDHPDPDDLLSLIRSGIGARGVIVLDSLGGLADWRNQTAWVRASQEAAAEGLARLLLIGQHNSGGGAAGEAAVAHDVDAEVEVTMEAGARLIAIKKNRNASTGRAYFDLGPNGATVPDLSHCAWSVEGEAEDLRLVGYPPPTKKGALWADYLRDLEAKKDLHPGEASAARRAPYLPSGYLIPRDHQARRDFAEFHGLTWREPHE